MYRNLRSIRSDHLHRHFCFQRTATDREVMSLEVLKPVSSVVRQ